MPVNELVRLVRVYSTPWEEKSAALKKLHEDYESNQRQLNIAIKRLKLVESQVNKHSVYQIMKKDNSISICDDYYDYLHKSFRSL